jgi:hypothetical protein
MTEWQSTAPRVSLSISRVLPKRVEILELLAAGYDLRWSCFVSEANRLDLPRGFSAWAGVELRSSDDGEGDDHGRNLVIVVAAFSSVTRAVSFNGTLLS